MKHFLRLLAISSLIFSNSFAAESIAKAEAKSHPLVTSLAGDLPIILSAPHGGRDAVPDVPVRLGKGVEKFVPKSDADTDRLTAELADAIAKVTGKRPYVVIARFHRKFIDANRAPELAYESDNAKATYEAYQQAIVEARQKIIDRWGSGILLDIHGQALAANTIFRGTQNGKTAAHLVKQFGEDALTGEKSLFGQLAKQGFTVVPPIDSHDEENHYIGGYIVTTYGSASGGTFDAIQLELGKALRSAVERTKTVEKMSLAITAFAEDYLPKKELVANNLKAQNKIVVGVYHDKGAGPSVSDLTKALATFENVTFQNLMADDIKSGKLKDIDVLIQPGGSGGNQGRQLGEEGREKIRVFVSHGGGYLGICAGSYLATADYEWSLNILDAKVVDRAHWARGKGTVEIELSAQGKQSLKNKNDRLQIHYAQGPLLAPVNNPDIPDFQTLATFKTEIALNGAPQGVMLGTTAAAEGQFGRGRVICFSPHPEMTKGIENLIQNAINSVNQSSSKNSTQQEKAR
jgi:N-formylglutamate amidohydrolase/glutamine amidotransferase PdxT